MREYESKIVKRGFQPLFFKGVDAKFPPDKETVVIVLFGGDFLTGYYDYKTRKWYARLGSIVEEIAKEGVACWSELNTKDIFGGIENE